MCGIAGAWEYKGQVRAETLARMNDALRHRGPDDGGTFIDARHPVGLAHRRLSILDLSAAGHQPMERGDLVVTYNGEIYNFCEIRERLTREGVSFTSHSDTEVMLQAFNRWGSKAVHSFRGMFAFALWDKRRAVLTLYRDRAGVKPLYYYAGRDRFVFASELKSLLAHGSVPKELDTDALALFLRFGYLPSPTSIFKDVYQLEPGHFLEVSATGVRKERYWDLAAFARKAPAAPEEDAALVETERVLAEAFALRTVSDVPVGVFLSGGIDSSLVAALLSKTSPRPLRTFTVGFTEGEFNEAGYAKQVAAHLGTEHHELYLTPQKAVDIVAKLPELFDEPFGSASAIPTFLVSEFARQHVTVALSADGGDELFGGYGLRYAAFARTYEKYAALPRVLGAAARAAVAGMPSGMSIPLRLELLAARGSVADTFAVLNKKMFTSEQLSRLLKGRFASDYAQGYERHFAELADLDPLRQMQLVDFRTNLPDHILTKVDRASMAVSLESREPFLDHLVAEHAVSLPLALTWQHTTDKYLLKKILYKHVPRELVDRPKHGFSMPIKSLLTHAPRDLVGEYLDDARIGREGVFDPAAVREEKERFLSGVSSPAALWRLIVFQMWKEYWGV